MAEIIENSKDERVDDLLEVQINIDDMNPESYGYIMELLFQSGARDVFLTPIIMKKGRPGILLTLLADQNKLESLEEIIFTETSTFGLRYRTVSCHRLARSHQTVQIAWGEVRVKIGYRKGKVVQYSPEYEDCVALAKKMKIPLKDIYSAVREILIEI